jgi:hypothetical protein
MMFYTAMAVHILTYGTEIWTKKKDRKQKLKLQKEKNVSSAVGCTRKGQINTKIRE